MNSTKRAPWNPYRRNNLTDNLRIYAKTKRNFEIFSAEEFIAALTQHIPDKGFQMVHYYGWYSNRARGDRAKHEAE